MLGASVELGTKSCVEFNLSTSTIKIMVSLSSLCAFACIHSFRLLQLSDMGSVSSLTVSEPDLSTTSADTHRASQDSDHSLPQPAATSHLHAPGNFRDSPGARVNTSNKTPYLSPAGLSCEVSTLTMTPSHLGSYSSAPGDISQTLMTSAEQASMFARQERNLFREEFVQGFLTDHMSLLQTRIEETMQRLGLDEDKT